MATSTPAQPIVPTNTDFATEVKIDRLVLMWRVTALFATIILLIALFIASSDTANEILTWVVAPLFLIISCFVTRTLLKLDWFTPAAWVYTLGAIFAVGIALWGGQSSVNDSGDIFVNQALPFAFVVIIFVGGLLLPPSDTFVLAFIATLITFLIPYVHAGNFDFIITHQGFAVALIFIGALLAAQVTGELYAVTEWALSNYQRERQTNNDLFESQTELNRTLKRSEALSDKLADINQELEVANEEAEAAKNFRGQFLANMSHELRTPLNAIIGFSETMLKFPMMYDDVPLPQAYEDDMNQIFNSGRQLLNLINDILDLSRVDAGKLDIFMERVELRPILTSVQSIAKGLLGNKQVQLFAETPDPLPDIWADQNRFRQVLVNLYSNACKFTDEGSITLRVQNSDEGILFSVTDTGSGISPDQMSIIFEEFKQATVNQGRDPRAGSGLGLAISRQLLSLMGGCIWAESTLGEGSTFHFILPPYHKDERKTAEVNSLRSAMRDHNGIALEEASKNIMSNTENTTQGTT